MKNNINSKNQKFTVLAWVLALLILAISIPLNLIFDRLNVNIDMSPNDMYTLSKTTTDFLDELDAQGEVVDVYFLQKLENLEGDLEVLALYRTLLAYDAHDCFNLIDIDPDTEPEILRQINPENKFNLSDNDFLFVHDNYVKRLPASMMYVYKMGTNQNGEEYVVDADFRAENCFTGYMKTVVEGIVPTVYFLEGHGENPLSEMTKLDANLKNYNYGAKSLNLINADAVPADCCILVIAGPTSDISQEEYDKIIDYTRTGGHLIMLMTPNEGSFNYTNLLALANTFCLGFDYNRISETDVSRHKSGDPYTFMCDLVEAGEDTEGDITSILMDSTLQTYMPASRGIHEIYGNNYSSCAIGTQLRTATTAYAEPYGGQAEDIDPVTGQQIPLAMHSKDALRQDAKLALFGSAEFITDTGASNEFYIVPLQLFLSTITWMYNSDVDMNISNKARTYDSLNVNSSQEASTLIATFVIFPALIALAGVVIWLRRKDA